MKIALATTTIHVPHALKLLRKCSADVKFFIALDKNSDFNGVAEHMPSDEMNSWLTPDWQKRWKCSDALGWNTIARRNIAFLEALSWGADVIYSWDDDNLPIDEDHFRNIKDRFEIPVGKIVGGWMWPEGTPAVFNGIQVSNSKGWFDPGSLLIPPTRQRGVPWNHFHANWSEPVVDAKVGVVSGLIIGDPDCDASTRMEKAPDISSVHMLGQSGVVVDPKTWTIWNSQNTAILRELVPAFFLMPGIGRHDDVYGSLIVQRVMRERGYCVHLGAPFCYQARNSHNLLADLRAEIDGMENVQKLANFLDSVQLLGGSVIADTRIIYSALMSCDFIPTWSVLAALQWLEDVESVL